MQLLNAWQVPFFRIFSIGKGFPFPQVTALGVRTEGIDHRINLAAGCGTRNRSSQWLWKEESPSKLQSSIIPAPVHTKHPWFSKLFSKNLGPFWGCFDIWGMGFLASGILGSVNKTRPPNLTSRFRSFTMNILGRPIMSNIIRLFRWYVDTYILWVNITSNS